MKKFFTYLVAIAVFASITFNIQSVLAENTDVINQVVDENDDTDIDLYNDDDELNETDDLVEDDTNNDMIENLLYGTGGIIAGSALTYFLTRNKETI